MRLVDYFVGQRFELRSPLSKAEVLDRIRRAGSSWFSPFSDGLKFTTALGGIRLKYVELWFWDYNAKPILAGKIEDDLGASRLTAKFRAPTFAYFSFPFWYLMLAQVSIAALSAPDAPKAVFVIVLLMAVFPLILHYVFTRNSDEELQALLHFLSNEAKFELVE